MQRVRGVANSLLFHAQTKCGLKFQAHDAVTAWAWVHAGWILTRFATRGLMSPFEVICGRAYRGKLVEFLEPILAYVHVQGQQKGLPKWEKAIFLSKTGMNDMFIVGLNGCIRLTRSVRRIPVPWSDTSAIELYSQMNVQPWQLEGVTGTRLLASKMPNQGVASAVEDASGLLLESFVPQLAASGTPDDCRGPAK